MRHKFKFIENLLVSRIMIVLCFILFVLPTFYVYFGYDISKYSNIYEYFPLTNMNMAFIINVFIYVLPILCTLSISQYAKDQQNLAPFIFTRVNKKKEMISSAGASFLWGFLIIFIILILMYAISFAGVNKNVTYFPSELRNINFEGFVNKDFPFVDLYYNHTYLFHLFYIFYISFYCGLLSLLCYGLNLHIGAGYSIILYIFSGSLVLILLFGLFHNGLVVWYPQNLLLADPLLASNPGVFSNIMGKLVLVISLLVMSVTLICLKLVSKEV